MLQNRVDPLGHLIRTEARGQWMGNRGCIHDAHQQIVRPFRLKAWLICLLEFKGRKRNVMTEGQYTELFFLDEATAFAAGHRPCFECRRQDHIRFRRYWLKGNPGYGFTERTSIQQIDFILHEERMDPRGSKITFKEKAASLPDGTFILLDNVPFLLWKKRLYKWTSSGYENGGGVADEQIMTLLTPRSTVNTFKAGYKPQVHTSVAVPDSSEG
ncbi:hypothetical protein [Niabella beijingensis]|uniref:hypothetical protein n=1 Tax=Niabella beijingensis TaxID=2872700 RepID=UPI001CBF4963|nr:hypothetical protein [Niabella beijingensis]MBZ4190977.1 hypothetical protein [Niabella beijingensis]